MQKNLNLIHHCLWKKAGASVLFICSCIFFPEKVGDAGSDVCELSADIQILLSGRTMRFLTRFLLSWPISDEATGRYFLFSGGGSCTFPTMVSPERLCVSGSFIFWEASSVADSLSGQFGKDTPRLSDWTSRYQVYCRYQTHGKVLVSLCILELSNIDEVFPDKVMGSHFTLHMKGLRLALMHFWGFCNFLIWRISYSMNLSRCIRFDCALGIPPVTDLKDFLFGCNEMQYQVRVTVVYQI